MTEHHEAPGGASKALRSSDGPEGGGSRNHEAANRTHKDIPQATVARLATYLRVLAMLADDGVLIVSSEELAVAAGVNSAKLRKDLSFLGPNGVRGVGYDVAKLRTRIEDVLGLSEGTASCWSARETSVAPSSATADSGAADSPLSACSTTIPR